MDLTASDGTHIISVLQAHRCGVLIKGSLDGPTEVILHPRKGPQIHAKALIPAEAIFLAFRQFTPAKLPFWEHVFAWFQ